MQHLLRLPVAFIGEANIFESNSLFKTLQHEGVFLLPHVIGCIHKLEDLFTRP